MEFKKATSLLSVGSIARHHQLRYTSFAIWSTCDDQRAEGGRARHALRRRGGLGLRGQVHRRQWARWVDVPRILQQVHGLDALITTMGLNFLHNFAPWKGGGWAIHARSFARVVSAPRAQPGRRRGRLSKPGRVISPASPASDSTVVLLVLLNESVLLFLKLLLRWTMRHAVK